MSHLPHFLRRQTHAETPGKPKDKKGKLSAAAPPPIQTGPASASASTSRLVPRDAHTIPASISPASSSRYFQYEAEGDAGRHYQPPASPENAYTPSVHSWISEERSEDTHRAGAGRDREHDREKDARSIMSYDSGARRDRERDGSTSPKSRSATSSPTRGLESPRLEERRRGAGGARPRTAGDASPPDSRRRTRSERTHQSPLAKLLGEDIPFVLPHPSKSGPTDYPGVVLGAFGGQAGQGMGMGFGLDQVGLDGTMEDVMDMSAPRADGRHGSAAGANIAPWLAEDSSRSPGQLTPVDRSVANTPSNSRKQSLSLNHSSSVPSFQRMRRTDTGGATLGELSEADAGPSASSSRSGSHPDLDRHPHDMSTDSVNTLSAFTGRQRGLTHHSELFIPPGGGRSASLAPSRIRGSTASTLSGSGSSKKGFLGGFLKRKGTGVPTAIPDFTPSEGSRGSGSGSGSSRLSDSTSFGSHSKASLPQLSAADMLHAQGFSHEDLVSPLSELGEFHLDMNLDDMEGIVDPTLANAPPQTVPASVSSSNTGTNFSSLGFDDRGQSFATTVSSGSAESAPEQRRVLDEADRQTFSRQNPFANSSPTSSIDGRSPQSPQNMSPKHTLAHPSFQPRRPSQLRNVKLGSQVSEGSDATDSLQPLAPAWAMAQSGTTVFQDPFGSSRPNTSDGVDRVQALKNADAAAAWAAPESWGVEGDEDEGEATSSSEDEAGWAGEEALSPPPEALERRSSTTPTSPRREAPPFGHKSGRGKATRPPTSSRRPRTGQGRQSTSSRTRDRPGTSGSVHSTIPHWIRIYRADGTFTVMAFSLATTTAEIINVLSGANDAAPGKKVTTSMKLYLRERGQDRMLLPSERPLAIQDRRLRQAGFTDLEKPEELGKEDLATLCKFIYQTPVLPVMDPEEENQYDSFEFIDIAGRDLQTIPIFLHLHAHNIIILNISRNPMTDIPLDFIQACTSLKELRMSNMALKRVPASIRASTSLARLDVSSNRIADLESVNLHEIGTLLSLKVQNNKLTSIPTYFAQMKALKYLNISNNKFETFPAVVCEMSCLVDLDVSFNNIAELPAKMSELRSLEKLAVFGNELTQFPDSFSMLANLRDLDVRRNKLTDLNAVYALPNLTRLQADWNNIVTLDAQLGAKVKTFSVPHNSITRFTLAPLPGATAVTYSLTHLNLSHAKISTLADEAFSGLVNLIDLNLDFNQFTRLPGTLDRLTNLEVFSCTDNALNDLPLAFGKMQKLRVLNVHNNNLRTIPPDVWGCGSLESCNASSNLLTHWEEPPADLVSMIGAEAAAVAARKMSIVSQPGEKVSSMPVPPAGMSMLRLYLADNHLNDDVFHQVSQMPNLQVLNLSFNDIYEIPPATLPNNDRLEALYLSGNKLTSLPSEDLEKLQRLRILHLNGNKLQTLPSELGAIKSLQHLDVGSNVLKYNIANWPYDWNWNWNTALRYLNLSGNKRLEIKPTSGQDMSQASSFRKELSDFTALTHLKVLGLMDVTLRISSLPDESDEKRVRTSFAELNNMRYGISDILGTNDSLALFDLVAPNFRGRANECVFGMFGRSAPSMPSGKVPKFLQETFVGMLQSELERLANGERPVDALRRTFLYEDRKAFEFIMGSAKERKESSASFASVDSLFKNWQPNASSQFRTGASGAIVYLADRLLHVATVGAHSVVLSRKGEAELLTKMHDPTEREETARIRRAEGWVSSKGLVNEDKDLTISRAFGYWHHFPAINASPDLRERQLTDADEFVIVGNHSLWQCCSYQTAVDIARTERDDPMMAAQKLRDFAISYGAVGSVMVMVVNVSDLFFGRQRRGYAAGPANAEEDYNQGAARRAMRRRYEEVGDRTLNRLQQEIEPPTGQVAIVFTDIVNSTHLWETNPGMPSSIKIHHNLMRRQLRLDGGYEVKTEGDSFMVSFQSVMSALLWCFNCQILLLQQEWPRELMEAHDGKVVYDSEGNIVQRGLRVRMGVHWGAPQCEKDPITRRMDYYGPMVNRAARINASADGGQLMASQDVLNELHAIREYVASLDEEGSSDLPPELTREVQELRRIGLEVKDMGERKLKGLEVPEKLHLLYPKVLAGRFEISSNINRTVEVQPAPIFVEPRQINIEEVRQLVMVCLRLEALSSGQSVGGSGAPTTTTTRSRPSTPMQSPRIGSGARLEDAPATLSPQHNRQQLVATRQKRSTIVGPILNRPALPLHLGPHIRDDMTDDELCVVIESLVTRIENSVSTMYLKQLGGFSSVLGALERATKIDQNLLVHAMALMSGMRRSL